LGKSYLLLVLQALMAKKKKNIVLPFKSAFYFFDLMNGRRFFGYKISGFFNIIFVFILDGGGLFCAIYVKLAFGNRDLK